MRALCREIPAIGSLLSYILYGISKRTQLPFSYSLGYGLCLIVLACVFVDVFWTLKLQKHLSIGHVLKIIIVMALLYLYQSKK